MWAGGKAELLRAKKHAQKELHVVISCFLTQSTGCCLRPFCPRKHVQNSKSEMDSFVTMSALMVPSLQKTILSSPNHDVSFRGPYDLVENSQNRESQLLGSR